MNTLSTPRVPESLALAADEHFFEASGQLADVSYDQYVASMPEAQWYGRYQDTTAAIASVLYQPKGDFDSRHAVVVPYSFANPQAPHMHIRNLAMQAIAAPNSQIIAFPNNTTTQRYYSFNAKTNQQVTGGDTTPLAESMYVALEEQGIESIDIIGYSQAAMVGATLLLLAQKRGMIKVKSALLADAPNVINRTPKQLERDFRETGFMPFVKSVQDAAIPALLQAQSMRFPRDTAKFARGMIGIVKSAKVAENAALHSAMSRDTLAEVIVEAIAERNGNFDTRLTAARAEKSKITPNTFTYQFFDALQLSGNYTIEGYGHEAADNVTGVFALLAKLAIHN